SLKTEHPAEVQEIERQDRIRRNNSQLPHPPPTPGEDLQFIDKSMMAFIYGNYHQVVHKEVVILEPDDILVGRELRGGVRHIYAKLYTGEGRKSRRVYLP